jgi:cytochrome b
MRLFHWALVACVVGAYICVKLGGLYMDWHVRLGCATLGLLAFRLIWGFIGPRYARFSRLLNGPRAILDYVRGGQRAAGHNPLGAYSALAMLLVLLFQACSGLFADDEIITQGPLAQYVDASVSSRLTALHRLDEWVLLILIGLHVAAVLWYTLARRQNLIASMITGDAPVAQLPPATQPAEDSWRIWLKALILALAATALVWALQNWPALGMAGAA